MSLTRCTLGHDRMDGGKLWEFGPGAVLLAQKPHHDHAVRILYLSPRCGRSSMG